MPYENVTDFVEDLLGDERVSFTFEEVSALSADLRTSISKLLRVLTEEWGLKYEGRPHGRVVRGYTASNLIWADPSMKMAGGSGHEQISGFAGQEG